MQRITSIGAAVTLLLWAGVGGCASSDSATGDVASNHPHHVALGVSASPEDWGDVVVTYDECPVAVQNTIAAQLHGGTIREIERTTDHGEVLYEVDVRGADGVVEFDVAENGEFRGFESDDSSSGSDSSGGSGSDSSDDAASGASGGSASGASGDDSSAASSDDSSTASDDDSDDI